MTSRMKASLQQEQSGFTLVELLVVILVLGILTAIALPSFLDERRKGQDAGIKSSVRNVVGEMAACYQHDGGFTNCPAVLAGTGLPIGNAPGEVRIISAGRDGFELSGVSKAQAAGGANHEFHLLYDIAAPARRGCLPIGAGGCGADEDGDGFGEW